MNAFESMATALGGSGERRRRASNSAPRSGEKPGNGGSVQCGNARTHRIETAADAGEEEGRVVRATKPRKKREPTLSARQVEALQYVFIGKTNDEIGQIMMISPLTVKNMVQSILKKLDAVNRAGAVYEALRRGILTPPVWVWPKAETAPPPPPVIQEPKALADEDWRVVGKIRMHWQRQLLEVNGVPLKLWALEFKLLYFFMLHPGRVFQRDVLLDQVWGVDVAFEERTVDVHISRLRTALEAVGLNDVIQTVRSAGYRIATAGEVVPAC